MKPRRLAEFVRFQAGRSFADPYGRCAIVAVVSPLEHVANVRGCLAGIDIQRGRRECDLGPIAGNVVEHRRPVRQRATRGCTAQPDIARRQIPDINLGVEIGMSRNKRFDIEDSDRRTGKSNFGAVVAGPWSRKIPDNHLIVVI